MRQPARPPHPFARLWGALLNLSEVIVAIRYQAPWTAVPLTLPTPTPERAPIPPHAKAAPLRERESVPA